MHLPRYMASRIQFKSEALVNLAVATLKVMNNGYRIVEALAPWVPSSVKALVRKYVPVKGLDYARRRARNPYHKGEERENYSGSPLRLGILEDVTQYHKHYIAACKDLRISYQLLNLLADDWLQRFQEAECDALLVWATSCDTALKGVYDYRLHILEHELAVCLLPTWHECWLTEHKPRLRDWMCAHGIPHARTWVFHERAAAMAFVERAELPIVVKTATGGSASGIRVLRSRGSLRRYVRRSFGVGITARGYDPRDRQRGCVYCQEYLPDVEEWRMVRIGDSYFGYRKERGPSGLHSASHAWSWIDPGLELLNLVKRVTDAGRFTSMDVDIFKTPDGRLLVNECQTVFGCSTPAIQMKVNDVEGRYVWSGGEWTFEAGAFSQNHMCNLRVKYLTEVLVGRPRCTIGESVSEVS